MLSCRIAILRKSAGMNQTQLALQLHVSASTVGMYEQGRRTPNLDVLRHMAQLFDVSLDYLITGAEHGGGCEDKSLRCCPCRHICGRLHCPEE